MDEYISKTSLLEAINADIAIPHNMAWIGDLEHGSVVIVTPRTTILVWGMI